MRIGLFVTCLIDMMRPEIGFSVIKLIERGLRGHRAAVADVLRPARLQLGDRPLARDLAEKTLREFEQFDYVVVPSGSCA